MKHEIDPWNRKARRLDFSRHAVPSPFVALARGAAKLCDLGSVRFFCQVRSMPAVLGSHRVILSRRLMMIRSTRRHFGHANGNSMRLNKLRIMAVNVA